MPAGRRYVDKGRAQAGAGVKVAVIRKIIARLFTKPAQRKSLLAVLATPRPLDEGFPPIPELPIDPIEL